MTKNQFWIGVFVMCGAVGSVFWLVSHAALPTWIVGENQGYNLAHSFLFDFFGLPASMLVATIAGFVGWQRFWLWGVAIALPVPFVDAVLRYNLVAEDLIEYSAVRTLESVAFSIMVAFQIALACILASALGAGAHIGIRKLTTRQGSGVQNGEAPR